MKKTKKNEEEKEEKKPSRFRVRFPGLAMEETALLSLNATI